MGQMWPAFDPQVPVKKKKNQHVALSKNYDYGVTFHMNPDVDKSFFFQKAFILFLVLKSAIHSTGNFG